MDSLEKSIVEEYTTLSIGDLTTSLALYFSGSAPDTDEKKSESYILAKPALVRLYEESPVQFEQIIKKIKNHLGYSLSSIRKEIEMLAIAPGGTRTTSAHATATRQTGTVEDYRETAQGLLWVKPTREGPIDVQLCNFTARIVTECEEDDGVDKRQTFEIAVTQGERSATVRMPWERFTAVNWPIEALGADAAIVPGPMARDHIRFAVQLLSKGAPRRKLYTHLGWRKVDEQWVYLHADGAIGATGPVPDIEVVPPAALVDYRLPPPPNGDARIQAVRASLRILEVAPRRVSAPPYSALWRGVMGGTDFSVHLTGPTGEGKTELAALLQQHHGASMNARHLPASWLSTGNSLEGLAFAAKDALLVIDDFAPTGSTADVQRYHREADRVGRAQGNAAGRQRMRADGSLRPAKPPRGLLLTTGEDTPRGHSLRARTVVIEVSPGDIRWTTLTNCQKDAADGVYAQAMAAFLAWVAPQYETVLAEVKELALALRDQGPGHHKRTPDILANVAAGVFLFLRFALDIEAVSAEEEARYRSELWTALCNTADAQTQLHADSDPVARCLHILISVITSGRGHLAAINGGDPDDAEMWGWEVRFTGHGEDEHPITRPKGKKIGWIAEEDIYLDPDSSFAAIQELVHAQGDAFPITQRTLHKRLSERGLLASTGASEGRETLKVRREIEGARRQVLHLRKNILLDGLPPYKKPDQPDQPPPNGTPPPHPAPDHEKKPDPGQFTGQVEQPDLTRESEADSRTSDSLVRLVRLNIGEERPDQENKNGPLLGGQVGQVRSGFPDQANLTSTAEEEQSPEFRSDAREEEEVF